MANEIKTNFRLLELKVYFFSQIRSSAKFEYRFVGNKPASTAGRSDAQGGSASKSSAPLHRNGGSNSLRISGGGVGGGGSRFRSLRRGEKVLGEPGSPGASVAVSPVEEERGPGARRWRPLPSVLLGRRSKRPGKKRKRRRDIAVPSVVEVDCPSATAVTELPGGGYSTFLPSPTRRAERDVLTPIKQQQGSSLFKEQVPN